MKSILTVWLLLLAVAYPATKVGSTTINQTQFGSSQVRDSRLTPAVAGDNFAWFTEAIEALNPVMFHKADEASGIVSLDSAGDADGEYKPNAAGAWTGGTLATAGPYSGFRGADFAGTGYVDAPLTAWRGPMSLVALVKVPADTTGGVVASAFTEVTPSTYTGWLQIKVNSDRTVTAFVANSENVVYWRETTPAISADAWHMIVLRMGTSSGMSLSIDGEQYAGTVWFTSTVNTPPYFRIGASTSDGAPVTVFDGEISSRALFDYDIGAISEAGIYAAYTGDLPVYDVDPVIAANMFGQPGMISGTVWGNVASSGYRWLKNGVHDPAYDDETVYGGTLVDGDEVILQAWGENVVGEDTANSASLAWVEPDPVEAFDAGQWAAAAFPAYAPESAGTIYHVEDYGAIPDDQLDDTTAFRAAYAAAKTAVGHGTVMLGSGTYIVKPDTGTGYVLTAARSNMTIESEEGAAATTVICLAPDFQNPDSNLIFRRGGFWNLTNTAATLLDPMVNVALRGIRLCGMAQVTPTAGQDWQTDPGIPSGSYAGWDVNHKPFAIFNTHCDNIRVISCEFDHWRGEEVYAGGANELGDMTIRHCVLRRCNASALSMGGNILTDQTHIYDVYNALENFAYSNTQSSTVTDCVIEPNRTNLGPSFGEGVGNFGVVYLGFPEATLTVTGSQFGKSKNGAIFLSEGGSNVTITGNEFTDTRALYAIHLDTYEGISEYLDHWDNWEFSGNTLTATTKNVDAAITGTLENRTPENWIFDDNAFVSENGFRYNYGIDIVNGADAPFIWSNTTFGSTIPSADHQRPRPLWTGSTTSALGTATFTYTGDITYIKPTWWKQTVECPAGEQTTILMGTALANYQDGFQFTLTRYPDTADLSGLEVPAGTFTSASRGYIISGDCALLLEKNGALFDVVSWTPPSANIRTLTQATYYGHLDAATIDIFGQAEVNLNPTVAHTWTNWQGIASGTSVTVNVANANVTIDHQAGYLECPGGVDYVATGADTLYLTRSIDKAFLTDAPFTGLLAVARPAVTGTIAPGQILTTTNGIWLEATSYTYQWKRDGVDISGETSSTYELLTTDYGTTISCVVTATDGVDSIPVESNEVEIDYAPTMTSEVYKTVGATDIGLDVYYTPGATDRSALIFVHGGGWTAGTKANHTDHCVHFAALGYVAVNIEYRLVAGAVDLFDQVADVRAAVRWVRENAATYGVDPNDIVIVGESAGGHLAGTAAFIDAFDDLGGDQGVSSRPNRAVLVNPITYLPGIPWYSGHAAQVGATPVPNDLTQLTPASTGADDSLRLSPLLYAAIAGQPDVLFIHGDIDSNVPYAQSEDFHDLLIANSNTSTLETMVGSNHAFFIPGSGSAEEIAATLALIETFLGTP